MQAIKTKIQAVALTVCFFLLTLLTSAQTLKGRVSDAATGEPLVGATVNIQGASKMAIVKLDGRFAFNGVATGQHTIKVTYQGYAPFEQTISIATDNNEIDIRLEPTSPELSSIVVSTTNDRDKAARNLERRSDPLLNVLSARTIQLLPDITVANVLQRVSGVTIERSGSGEARYPIIRGMEKRYINTLVNGIKIPSPDNKNRFIPLDLFPSELLERLEVSKSLTPSMEGDAIGGTINLVMKEAPQTQLFQINAAVGYNNIFNQESFLKFDKSSINKLSPAEVNGASYAAKPSDFPSAHLNYTPRETPVNTTFGATYGNHFGKARRYGFIVSGSYQNIFRGTTSNFFLPNSQPGFENIPLFSELQLRKYSVQSQRAGLNGKLDFQINKNNKISLVNTFVRLDDYQTRIIYDTVALNSLVDNFQRSTWQYQSIYNSTLQGLHKLSNKNTFDWSLVYSVANNHIPDQSQFSHELPNTQAAQDKLLKLSRLWLHNSDKDYSAYLNFTRKANLLARSLEWKAGGLIRNKTRTNFYSSYGLSAQPGEAYTTIDKAIWQFEKTGDNLFTPNGNNYTFEERIGAGYLQGKWQLSRSLEAIGGLRVEATHQHYETKLGPDVDAKSGTIYYTDLLPSLQFKYTLTARQSVRLSYYKALARPGFAELIPDGVDGEFFKEQGDPVNLKHTIADNLDLRYELFGKSADQVLLGVFYKNIKDPIEITAIKPKNINNLYLQPVNIGTATNYGFEAVVAKYIGSFGISANYTYTKSSITNDSMIYASRPSKRVSETRPLQGQSNNIGNVSFIYKNPKIGFDFQTALVYTGERISFISPYYGLHYWQSPTTQLDLSFEKRIIKKLTLYGKINNLTNAPFELSLHQSYNTYLAASGSRALALQSDPDNRIIIQKDYYRTSYLFGLRYKL